MSLYERMTASGATLLLDGEIGGGLRKRVPEQDKALVPASVLLDSPSIVRDLHLDYIAAGAQVITTNTYATVKARMEKLLGAGDRWEEALNTACQMAKEAVAESGKEVLIAGSLPPLHGSYRPELVGATEDILPVYKEHVAIMSKYVDLFLCETMSNASEAWAAVSAAKGSGKPVWCSLNLDDDTLGKAMRSGETVQEVWSKIGELKPDAVLVNCVAPETVSAAMPILASLGVGLFGGYGNGFISIPKGWTTQNSGISALGKRYDLTPYVYAAMALQWKASGARIIGGCCEVGAAHIKALREKLDEEGTADTATSIEKEELKAFNEVASSCSRTTRASPPRFGPYTKCDETCQH